MRRRVSLSLAPAFLLVLGGARAQAPGPAPVRVTPAESYTFQGEIRLPGAVESRKVSTVASEIDGLVEEFPVEEGDRVEKGQLLAKLRTKPLELDKASITADLDEARARQKLAQRNLERARELFDAKVASQEELDAALYEFNAWEGREARLEAQIARIQEDIERGEILAPFKGVVVGEQTEVGQWLARGDPVVDLLSMDDLQVEVHVPERYYSRFQKGGRVRVAFPALGGREVVGMVDAVIPRASSEARAFPVKLTFPNPDGQAAAGMVAEAIFPGGEPRQELIVPKDALVNQGAQRLVYVVNEQNQAQAVPVQPGAGVGQWVAVTGGVRSGDRVVTRGNERLAPGQPVAPQPLEYKLP